MFMGAGKLSFFKDPNRIIPCLPKKRDLLHNVEILLKEGAQADRTDYTSDGG